MNDNESFIHRNIWSICVMPRKTWFIGLASTVLTTALVWSRLIAFMIGMISTNICVAIRMCRSKFSGVFFMTSPKTWTRWVESGPTPG